MNVNYKFLNRLALITYKYSCFSFLFLLTCQFFQVCIVEATPKDQGFKVVVQTNHTAQINSILHSEITHQIISASNDNFIRVWSTSPGQEYGRLLHILQGHTDNVTATSIQPEGKNLVSGDRDGKVILWNLFSGEIESEVLLGEKVVAITYSDDTDQNSIAVALEGEKSVHFFDATKTLKESSSVDISQSGGEITTMLAYNSWRQIACGTTAGEVILLNVTTKKTPQIIKVSSSKIMTIGRLNDETLVWMDEGGSVGTVSMIQPNSMSEQWKCIQAGKIVSASYSLNDKLFSIVTSKGIVQWIDPLTRRNKSIEHQSASSVASIESGQIVIGTRDGRLQWFTRSSMIEASVPQGSNVIQRAVVAGKYALAIMNQNYELWVWDYANGTSTLFQLPDKSGADYHLSYSSSGDRLAIGTGSSNTSIYILHQDSLVSIGSNLTAVKGLTFIPGTNNLLSIHANGMINLWNTETKQLITQTKTSQPQLALSMAGNLFVTIEKKIIRKWDTSTLRIIDSSVVSEGTLTTCEIDSSSGSIAVGYENGNIGIRAGGVMSKEILCKGHTSKINQLRWVADILTPSKRTLLSCSKDNSTRLWSSAGKQLVSSINHYTEVWDLDIIPNRNLAASVGNDGTCVLFDMRSLLPVIKLVTIAPSSWVAVTPDGFFDASSTGIGAVNIVSENHSLPLENYITLLEKPSILSQIIGTIKSTEKRESAEQGYLSKLFEKPTPSIRIISPLSVKYFSQDVILLTVELSLTSTKIKEIRAVNNGNPLYISDEEPLRGMMTIPLQLYPGKNLLRVICVTSNGVESFDTVTVYSTSQPQVKPNLYILAVGISSYKNREYDLKYAQNDAESLCASLRENFSKSEYNTVSIKQLVNDNATVSSLNSAFDDIAGQIHINDRFIFYFAGHGTLISNRNSMSTGDIRADPSPLLKTESLQPSGELSSTDKEYYLVTHEIESVRDVQSLQQFGMSLQKLQAKFLNIKCEKKAIILDACHSGAITSTFIEEQSGTTKALRQLPRNSGVYLMSAALSTQVARESDYLKHGLFTTALIEGLNGRAASSEDKQVSLFTLQDYIQKRIKKLVTDSHTNQTPIFRSDDTDGFIVTQLNN
ncbi:MAG: caspase family protein [Ignavibacteria bacterium]|nr:caspase family protein [Ignavibacteria bacterium]